MDAELRRRRLVLRHVLPRQERAAHPPREVLSGARPRLRAAAPALALAAVALAALGFQAWLPRALPSDGDYQALAAVLQAERRPGDVVLLHPWWLERARLFLPPGTPVVGYLGDETDDLVEHPRIWVLADEALPRAPDAALRRSFLPDRTALGPPRRAGPLTLTPYRNGRARTILLSAADALAHAEVSVETPGEAPIPCTQGGGRWSCPGGARAEVALHEVLYQPVRCLFTVPPGGARELVVRVPDVPASGTLLLEAGVTWEHAWKKERSDVNVTLAAASGTLRLRVPGGHEGLVRGEVPGGVAGPLRLSVQAQDPHEREVCIRLRALGGTPP